MALLKIKKDGAWKAVSVQGIQGEQGPKGDKGDKGDDGVVDYEKVEAYIDSAVGAAVETAIGGSY